MDFRKCRIFASASLWATLLGTLFINGAPSDSLRGNFTFHSVEDLVETAANISGMSREMALAIPIRFEDLGDASVAEWRGDAYDAVTGKTGTIVINTHYNGMKDLLRNPELMTTLAHELNHAEVTFTHSPLIQTINGMIAVNEARAYGTKDNDGALSSWRVDEITAHTVQVNAFLFMADQAMAQHDYEKAQAYVDKASEKYFNRIEPLKSDAILLNGIVANFRSTDDLIDLTTSQSQASGEKLTYYWYTANFTTQDGQTAKAQVWIENYNKAYPDRPVTITLDISAKGPDGHEGKTTFTIAKMDTLDPGFIDGTFQPKDIINYAFESARNQATAIYDTFNGPVTLQNAIQNEKMNAIEAKISFEHKMDWLYDHNMELVNTVFIATNVDAQANNEKSTSLAFAKEIDFRQAMNDYQSGLASFDLPSDVSNLFSGPSDASLPSFDSGSGSSSDTGFFTEASATGNASSAAQKQALAKALRAKNLITQSVVQFPLSMGGLAVRLGASQ